mgnify:CR=1 FL=1
MKLTRIFSLLGVVAMVQPLWAVYAPIPEQEQGKKFSVLVRAGISQDSNIFGSASSEIDSVVYSFSPTLSVNTSLTDQTFFTGSYMLALDHFTDRPGDKTLDSHTFMVRLAHAFSADSNIDLINTFNATRNPESTLAGVPINTDQSFKRNQFDGRFSSKLGHKMDGVVKFRTVFYSYDNATLASNIDRTENLYGVELGHQILPEVRLSGEYRHQTISYDSSGATKDKTSDFVIGGLDYQVAKKTSLTGRLGYEWRDRASEKSSSAPYVELSAKYDYAERSYIASGYIYTFEEASNTALYNDTKVSRFFVNVQHAVSALIVASGSINYEPSSLQGRRGVTDVDETITRFGLALTYLLNQNWTISGTYDHDKVKSDDPARGMKRDRFGINVALSF